MRSKNYKIGEFGYPHPGRMEIGEINTLIGSYEDSEYGRCMIVNEASSSC